MSRPPRSSSKIPAPATTGPASAGNRRPTHVAPNLFQRVTQDRRRVSVASLRLGRRHRERNELIAQAELVVECHQLVHPEVEAHATLLVPDGLHVSVTIADLDEIGVELAAGSG